MALTIKSYISDGVRTLYDVDFSLGYIDKSYVYVYQGNYEDYESQLSYTWVNNDQIELSDPVPNGETFYIRRVIPRDKTVNDYVNGSVLREKELNNSFQQAIMIEEEQTDGFFNPKSAYLNLIQELNMNGFKAISMGNADIAEDGDAVNVYTMKEYNTQADAVINARIDSEVLTLNERIDDEVNAIDLRVDGIDTRVTKNEQDIIDINKIIEDVPTFDSVADVKRTLHTEVDGNKLNVIAATQDTGAGYTLNATVIAAGDYTSWYNSAKASLGKKVYLHGEEGVEAPAGFTVSAGTTDLRDTQVEGFLDVEGQVDFRGGHPINFSATPQVNGNDVLTTATSVDPFSVGSIRDVRNSQEAPANYMRCRGQKLLRSDYPELFNEIGLQYSYGVSSNEFMLPRLYSKGASNIAKVNDVDAQDGGTGSSLCNFGTTNNYLQGKSGEIYLVTPLAGSQFNGMSWTVLFDQIYNDPYRIATGEDLTLYTGLFNSSTIKVYNWDASLWAYEELTTYSTTSLIEGIEVLDTYAGNAQKQVVITINRLDETNFGITVPKDQTTLAGGQLKHNGQYWSLKGVSSARSLIVDNVRKDNVIVFAGNTSTDMVTKIFTLTDLVNDGVNATPIKEYVRPQNITNSKSVIRDVVFVGNEIVLALGKDSQSAQLQYGDLDRVDIDTGVVMETLTVLNLNQCYYSRQLGMIGLSYGISGVSESQGVYKVDLPVLEEKMIRVS